MQLLSSEIYQQRFCNICELIDVVAKIAVPGPIMTPKAPELQCSAVITFIRVACGLVLPALILVWRAPPVVQAAVQSNPYERWLVIQLSCLTKINTGLSRLALTSGNRNRLQEQYGIRLNQALILWIYLWATIWLVSVVVTIR